MYFVYVIENSEGKRYTGFTENLERRLKQHNSEDGFKSYTHRFKLDWRVVFSQVFTLAKEARDYERYLKTGNGREFLKGCISAPADG